MKKTPTTHSPFGSSQDKPKNSEWILGMTSVESKKDRFDPFAKERRTGLAMTVRSI
jgi:hypothetical protein